MIYDVQTDNSQVTYSRQAEIEIESNGVIPQDQAIDFHAGDNILLQPGFEVVQQASFHAFILGCDE